MSGIVYLVGAGPGDAGLLTLRGAECLRRAEVVVYDYLANPELLRFCEPGTEIIYAGKSASQHELEQGEINQLLVDKGKSGKRVVRLKGGDPFIFGRGGEEAEALVAAGVLFEIVPGISSAIAAAAYAGIPVTHREATSAVTILTGHEDPTKPESALNWDALGKLDSTKVILMGVGNVGKIADALRRNAPAETPVAMIRWGTTGRQQTVIGTLADIAQRAEQAGVKPPAVIVIGKVVGLREKLNWFETKPLFGRRIVVTRTREQASELSHQFHDLGADVLEVPTIRIEPTKSPAILRDAIEGIGEYDWVVFTSPNAVVHFFGAFFEIYKDIRDIGGVKIAAIGPGTAARLEELHLQLDLMPEEFVAESVVKAFAKLDVENLKFLLPRADIARDALPEGLEALGAIVDKIECYRTVPETDDVTGNVSRLLAEGAGAITFTSSSTVENFCGLVNLAALRAKFPALKLASIGPITSATLKKLGFEPDIESAQHDIPGLVEAVMAAMGKGEPTA
ncbi:MAG: uroporphyrinogen-III C-methyltransferase [Verrucomicrobia bacterium]|nr:uroporphyrinogen-III C-methyltransferase [Verrucomicrobiota bacterium]